MITPFASFRRADDPLDPELEGLFASAHVPGPDDLELERARRIVASRLSRGAPPAAARAGAPASPGRGAVRRTATAGALGGGLWAILGGTAFAQKVVATALGLSLVVGSTAAVEVAGIGPAVRDALGIEVPLLDDEGTGGRPRDVRGGDPTAAATGGIAGTQGSDETLGLATATVEADGDFQVRAVLSAVGAETIGVETDDGPRLLTVDSATEIRVPGTGGSVPLADLEAYIGHLVIARGHCEAGSGDIGPGCSVASVNVLGSAGAPQGPPTDTPADASTEGAPAGSEETPPGDGGDEHPGQGEPGQGPVDPGQGQGHPGQGGGPDGTGPPGQQDGDSPGAGLNSTNPSTTPESEGSSSDSTGAQNGSTGSPPGQGAGETGLGQGQGGPANNPGQGQGLPAAGTTPDDDGATGLGQGGGNAGLGEENGLGQDNGNAYGHDNGSPNGAAHGQDNGNAP